MYIKLSVVKLLGQPEDDPFGAAGIERCGQL
jgi:hypothetical protein